MIMQNETKENELNDAVASPFEPIVRLRPVVLNNGKSAMFHTWGTFASEDGSCEWYGCNYIRFADRVRSQKPKHADIEKYGYSLWYCEKNNSWYATYEAGKGTVWYVWRNENFILLTDYGQIPDVLKQDW